MKTLLAAEQRMMGQPLLIVDLDLDGVCRGGPDGEMHAFGLNGRAERRSRRGRRALGHRGGSHRVAG